MSLRTLSLVLALLYTCALADMTPTAPGPGDRFKAGSNCTIKWEVDETGTWTNVAIDLKSGSNDNQTLVTNVVSGLDGTDPALMPLSWTCPEVNPYSAIYFYEFTNSGDTSTAKWTTRFTIASGTDNSLAPENVHQPNGDPIPWGIGELANGSSSTEEERASDTSVDSTQVDFQNLSRSKNQPEFQDGSDRDSDSETKDSGDDEKSSEDDSKSDEMGDEKDKDERLSGKTLDKGEGSSARHARHPEDSSAQADSDSQKQENSESGEASSATTTDGPKDKNPSHTQSVSSKPPASEGLGVGAKAASSAHSTTKTVPSTAGKSVQTPSLPSILPVKKAHPSETTPALAATPSASGSCQCAGDPKAGLKLTSGGPERQEISCWAILFPALIMFFVLL